MLQKLLFVFLFFVIHTKTAYGYIDPGTGSYIIQLLIAAIATGLYAIKYFWSSIRVFFQKIFSKKKKSPPPPRPSAPTTPMQAKKK